MALGHLAQKPCGEEQNGNLDEKHQNIVVWSGNKWLIHPVHS